MTSSTYPMMAQYPVVICPEMPFSRILLIERSPTTRPFHEMMAGGCSRGVPGVPLSSLTPIGALPRARALSDIAIRTSAGWRSNDGELWLLRISFGFGASEVDCDIATCCGIYASQGIP